MGTMQGTPTPAPNMCQSLLDYDMWWCMLFSDAFDLMNVWWWGLDGVPCGPGMLQALMTHGSFREYETPGFFAAPHQPPNLINNNNTNKKKKENNNNNNNNDNDNEYDYIIFGIIPYMLRYVVIL